MTMKITITNDASNNDGFHAVVQVRDITVDGEFVPASTQTLKPGESAECWIHNRRDIHVEEMAELPKAGA